MSLARALLATLCIGLLATAVARAQSSKDADTSDALFAAGCARLSAGDAPAAIESLSQAVARRPSESRFALKLVEAYEAADRDREAESLLNLLGEKFPGDDDVCIARATRLATSGKYDVALKLLDPRRDRLSAGTFRLWVDCVRAARGPAESERAIERGLKLFPTDVDLRIDYIESALRLRQHATALKRIDEARARLRNDPRLDLLTAEANFGLGRYLGDTAVRDIPGGRVGEFREEGLLIEQRGDADRFVVCGRDSALASVRRALDAGLDAPRTHLLHARIWQKAGKPEIGLQVLKNRESPLLESPTEATLDTFCDLALAAGALEDFLRYAQRRAERKPTEARPDALCAAYLAVAEVYNQRGDEPMYREFLRRALDQKSENPDLLLRLADCDWDAGRRDESTLLYRRVLEQKPAHPERARILERLAP